MEGSHDGQAFVHTDGTLVLLEGTLYSEDVYEEEKPPVGQLWQLWSFLAKVQPAASFIVLQIDSNTVYLLW